MDQTFAERVKDPVESGVERFVAWGNRTGPVMLGRAGALGALSGVFLRQLGHVKKGIPLRVMETVPLAGRVESVVHGEPCAVEYDVCYA